MESVLTKRQFKEFGPKVYQEHGDTMRIYAEVRYDDNCGNGHNSFAITGHTQRQDKKGRWVDESFGCVHDEIRKHFPNLAPYIKWHLCNSDGPMHYVSNTLYHASDKDCWGLRKGEMRQLVNGRSKLPVWEAVARDKEGNTHPLPTYKFPWIDAKDRPEPNGDIIYIPHMIVGEGKAPDLEAARSSAIWPDASLEQLQDKQALEARLPQLLADFQQAIESLGLIF